MLRPLKLKDKINFLFFAKDYNISPNLFRDFINQKKLAFVSEEHDSINGLIFVEHDDKDYLKLVASSKKIVNNLLKIFFWNYKKPIHAKIDISDKNGFILKNNGFRIIDKQENTFILHYNPNTKGKRYVKRNHR